MTKPIPPGGIRQRPARSCVACRSSKTKCVGAVVKDGVATADVKCTRCLRLDLECSFVDLRRFGRPRRNPVGVGSASSSRERKVKVEAKVDDDTEDAWEAVEEPRASRRIGPVEPKEHWSSSGSSSSSGGSTLVKGRAASPLPKGEPMYFEIPQLYPLPDLHTDRNPALDHVSFLARDYLENIHPFLALLPDDFADLTHYLRSSSPVLSMALYSLLNAAEQDVPIAHYATSLSDLQAAVVSVYCAYAGGRPNAGRDTLEWICGHIIGKGWHRIDAWSRETLLDYDQQFLDGVRVLWWECWCLEILMCITTGVRKLFLQSVDFNVRLGGGATSDSPFSLRIRALSLLLTSTETPPEGEDPMARIPALNNTASTLTFLAHQSYLSSCTLLKSTCYHRARISAEREAAFLAFLISSASTVFLLSSSSVFSSFVASAFPCGLDTTTVPARSSHYLIRSASQNIFSLIRTSLSPSIPAGVHSPFFGCSLLVAAQGTLLTMQPEEGSQSSGNDVMGDLQLAEWMLEQQSKMYRVGGGLLKEVRMLRMSVYGGSDEGAQLLLS